MVDGSGRQLRWSLSRSAESLLWSSRLMPAGAPWRIRLTDDIRALFVDDAPDGPGSPCSRPPSPTADARTLSLCSLARIYDDISSRCGFCCGPRQPLQIKACIRPTVCPA